MCVSIVKLKLVLSVAKIAAFGAFVQLEDDVDGLVHISQLSEEHVTKVKEVVSIGDEVEARVIKVDKAERRIGLSIKAASYSEEELKKETAASLLHHLQSQNAA